MKPFAWTPADGKPEHEVALLDARAVDQPVALDDADAGAREVELVVAVDAGQLGGLAAEEHAARGAADLGRALDELGHLLGLDRVRGDVVEQEERVGAGREHVVDAVRGEVGPARAQAAALAREDQLRADAVGRGGEQAPVVERVEAGEGAEARRPGRLDGRAQALDDGLALRDRDSGRLVGARLPHPRRV